MLTNRLNQDCLGNLFSCIRNSRGNSDSPPAPKFVNQLKNIVTNSFMHCYNFGNWANDNTPYLSFLDLGRSNKQYNFNTDNNTIEELELEKEIDDLQLLSNKNNDYLLLTSAPSVKLHTPVSGPSMFLHSVLS